MSSQKQTRGRKKTTEAKPEKVDKKSTKKAEEPKVQVEESKNELICIIRIRGSVHVNGEILDTMKMMNLFHINHATLVPNTPQYVGMINKAKDYISYGAIDRKILSELVAKRARITGNKKLTDEYIKENSDFKSLKEFEDAIFSCKATLRSVRGLKPVFRLHPPRGGHKGTIKKAFNAGGVLGKIDAHINDFLKRMI